MGEEVGKVNGNSGKGNKENEGERKGNESKCGKVQ